MPGLFEGFFTRHKRGITLTVLVLVSLFGLMISNLISKRTAVNQPDEIGLSVVSFFEKGFSGFFKWFADTAGSIRQLRQAREELSAAQQRLQDVERISREIVQLRDENRILRQQIDLSQNLAVKRIAAEVIAKNHDNLFSTITLNKGSRQGVKRDMPVVAFQAEMEGLVGKVVSVSAGSCQVLPLYDPLCQLSARIEISRFEGLVSGQGEDKPTLLMRYVKKIAIDTFEYGDLIVTAGLGGVYPKGINIGRVRDIQARNYETSLELEVEPVIDFSRLEYVFILDVSEIEPPPQIESENPVPSSAPAATAPKPAAAATPAAATPRTSTPPQQSPSAPAAAATPPSESPSTPEADVPAAVDSEPPAGTDEAPVGTQ
jgi:rod shape-determining protein MreC